MVSKRRIEEGNKRRWNVSQRRWKRHKRMSWNSMEK
jgi:hypothetical protein